MIPSLPPKVKEIVNLCGRCEAAKCEGRMEAAGEGFRALRVHGIEVLVQNELSMRDEK